MFIVAFRAKQPRKHKTKRVIWRCLCLRAAAALVRIVIAPARVRVSAKQLQQERRIAWA